MIKKSFTINLTPTPVEEAREATEGITTDTNTIDINAVLGSIDTAWKEGQWGIAEKQWDSMLDLASELPTDEEEAAVLNDAFRWLNASLTVSIITHNESGTRNPEILLNAAFLGSRLIGTFGVSDDSYWVNTLQATSDLNSDSSVFDALFDLWVLMEERVVVAA